MDGWPDDSIPRKAKYQVTMLETALALGRNGLGAAYLPNFVVRLHNESTKTAHQLIELAVPKKVRTINPVYLVKRRTDTENSTMRNLAKAVRAICSEA
jgi:DNA-binding transcriptional LysR family regulator